MLLKEIKKIYHKELGEIYSKEEVDSFFYILIEHYLGLERFVLALQPNISISKEKEQPLFKALSELRLQRPVQYIIGKTHFMDMDFLVDENVLIPRPETEELVRWILETSQASPDKNPTILDIGTGSGCIAISLAKNLPKAQVYGLDVSEPALEIARRNAKKNEVDTIFLQNDILTRPKLNRKFDSIVSNPPYVRDMEKKEMQKNVLEHEPDSALFVSDENPLVFYEAIARFAKKNLKINGILFLEINQYLAKETQALLEQYNFSEIELRKDMFGNDRLVKCTDLKN